MGVNILIYRQDWQEPEIDWDSARHSGDSEFAGLRGQLPVEHPPSTKELFRPADFQQWRSALGDFDHLNPGRWDKLLNILAAHPIYWLYLSW